MITESFKQNWFGERNKIFYSTIQNCFLFSKIYTWWFSVAAGCRLPLEDRYLPFTKTLMKLNLNSILCNFNKIFFDVTK